MRDHEREVNGWAVEEKNGEPVPGPLLLILPGGGQCQQHPHKELHLQILSGIWVSGGGHSPESKLSWVVSGEDRQGE